VLQQIQRINYRSREISIPGNPLAPFQTARRCQRGPDRHHTKRGERRATHSVKALGIAILRRVAASIASVPGQLRPGDIRRSRGPMRSCRNRKHHFKRAAAGASKRCSDPFERAHHAWERAATSGTAGSSRAPGNPRRTFGGLTGPLTLLPLGRLRPTYVWLRGLVERPPRSSGSSQCPLALTTDFFRGSAV